MDAQNDQLGLEMVELLKHLWKDSDGAGIKTTLFWLYTWEGMKSITKSLMEGYQQKPRLFLCNQTAF